MKNITLSVDAKTLQDVRRIAALSGTTVNAMVREFLRGIVRRESRARSTRQRLRELSDSSTARRGQGSWSREDLHERQRYGSLTVRNPFLD